MPKRTNNPILKVEIDLALDELERRGLIRKTGDFREGSPVYVAVDCKLKELPGGLSPTSKTFSQPAGKITGRLTNEPTSRPVPILTPATILLAGRRADRGTVWRRCRRMRAN